VSSVNVLKKNDPFAPYRSSILPVNAHTPPSVAQNVQSPGGGGVDGGWMAQCFAVSGAGSPNTTSGDLDHAAAQPNNANR
jgi:hypothetical protein